MFSGCCLSAFGPHRVIARAVCGNRAALPQTTHAAVAERMRLNRGVTRSSWLPALVGAFAAAVSLIGIGTPSLWGDEIATLMSATRPDLWAMVGHVDAVHGAYYLVMHAWLSVFGVSPLALRLPSALAVGVAAAGVVSLVRLFRPVGVAVLAGVLFALLPATVFIGGEARSYAGTAALAAWLMVAWVHAGRGGRRGVWLATALLGSFALIWFAYLGLLLMALALWQRSARSWLTLAASVLLASPVLWIAFGQRGQISWIAEAGLNGPAEVLTAWFGGAVWLAVLGWLLMLAVSWRGRADALVQGAALAAFVPIAVLWPASFVWPVFSPRYLAVSLPAAAVLLALALAGLWSRNRVAGALIAALMLGLAAPTLVGLREPFAKRDSDLALVAETLTAAAVPGDAVVFDESGKPWQRPRLVLHGYPATAVLADPTGRGLLPTDVWDTNVAPVAEADFTGITRVWLVEHRGEPSAQRAALEALGFTPGQTTELHSSQITEYTR